MSRSKDVVSLARRSPSCPANDLERAKQPCSLQLTGLDSRVGVARSSACAREPGGARAQQILICLMHARQEGSVHGRSCRQRWGRSR
jgi:hypothetical protein